MPAKPKHDWEAIEREYRAGQLSVSEIARQHGCSHTAINKKAKANHWLRNLVERVRERIETKLVSEEVSETNASAAVETAADRGVALVRSHRKDIGAGRLIVGVLMQELQETVAKRDEVEEAIHDDTPHHTDSKRRALMMRAVSLPSRAATVRELSQTLKNLIPLERQAFNIDAKPGDDPTDPGTTGGAAERLFSKLDSLVSDAKKRA